MVLPLASTLVLTDSHKISTIRYLNMEQFKCTSKSKHVLNQTSDCHGNGTLKYYNKENTFTLLQCHEKKLEGKGTTESY